MKNGICLKCRSTDVRRLETHDSQEGGPRPLRLKTHANPDAWLFKGTSYFDMYAIGCMKCGYVELYMADFDEADHEEWKEANSPETK